jgi:hypothetical protein
MDLNFQLNHARRQGRNKFRFSGNPLALVLFVAVLVWLFLILHAAVNLVWDGYFPYQGRVLNIETRWADYVTGELVHWEHLIIETPEGETVDKLLSFERRVTSRIKKGDYVVKKRGFFNRVRPRDKKTTQEMLEEAQRALEEFGS